MAVTAHWIQTTKTETPSGARDILTLRANLIGFQRVPGRHDGEHLAEAFLYVTNRLDINSKVIMLQLDSSFHI